AFAVAQLEVRPVAILAPVAIARKQECVGDLATEAAGDVHELDEADDGGSREGQAFTSDQPPFVRFDYLGFALYDERQRPRDGHQRQRLERGVTCETAHGSAPGWSGNSAGNRYPARCTVTSRTAGRQGGAPVKPRCITTRCVDGPAGRPGR